MQLSEHRPTSVLVHAAEWQPRSRIDPGPSPPLAPSSFPSSSSSPQRRRSSVLHPPPPVPPPNQPIPSVPLLDTHSQDNIFVSDDAYNQIPGPGSYFARPAASPRLVSVAAFPHTQALQASSSHMPPAPSFSTNGSASPPRPETNSGQHQEIVPDRLLLSPGEPSQATEPRPSSRRALTRALELAREAVKLDSNNDDPHGAVIAYGKSVALLSKVMERVMRGEDSTESNRRRGGRRRSVVAQEEEVKRLKAIHDTYADRMNILCLIYNIPTQPSSPNSQYPSSISTSTTSTQPSSPVSVSPTSDDSDPLPRPSHSHSDIDSDAECRRLSQETARYNGDLFVGSYSVEESSSSHHPYAAPPQILSPTEPSPHPPPAISAPPTSSQIRSSISARPPGPYTTRPRASSNLPPPVPPPQNALPPAPDEAPAIQHLSTSSQARGNSASSHVRTNSGSRLGLVPEEYDDHLPQTAQRSHFNMEEDFQPRSRNGQSTRDPNRDSHPLPPLPSPSISSDSSTELLTPRTHPSDMDPSPPGPTKFVTPRPRGSSTLSVRSEMSSSSTLINSSTIMGTISQRRSKASAPPSTGSPSPKLPDAAPSSALKTSESTTGLPVAPPQPVGYGRSRASSQPGHRPHLNGLPPSSFELSNRPNSSMISGLPTAPTPRKPSSTAKNGSSLPQITVITGAMSPPPSTPNLQLVTQLVPPPPIPHGTLPTTPTSPLPPVAPTDPMRKPYHMMNLLRHTMTSKSGGYITRRLHVPQEVWSQGGAKLSNLPEKVRVVEVLCSALEDLARCSGDIFGPGNVSSGMGMGIGSVGKKEGEQWAVRLEDFSGVCDGVVANFGKKLGVGEGFVTKKNSGVTSWGGKLTRQFDKLTSQKNLDSPASYVQGLNRLFQQAQLLDEHCKAITLQPIAPTYAALPMDVRMAIDSKLRHSSEFFATVVLTFVIRDLAQLLDKYVKKCEKWLAE